MMSPKNETINRTVSQLADEVDYWKGRAIRAEETIKREREERIREHPELWDCYVGFTRMLGLKPAKRETELH